MILFESAQTVRPGKRRSLHHNTSMMITEILATGSRAAILDTMCMCYHWLNTVKIKLRAHYGGKLTFSYSPQQNISLD